VQRDVFDGAQISLSATGADILIYNFRGFSQAIYKEASLAP
jgi:hypothetical protein